MENLFYSNVMIPADTPWRQRILELIGGRPVGFRLVKITQSQNWVVQISSTDREELSSLLDRALETV